MNNKNNDDNFDLERHGITLDPGTRSINDKIVKFHGDPLNMAILGTIFLEMCKFQDDHSLDGKGSESLMQYLEEIRKKGKLTPEIRSKYRSLENPTTTELFGHPITLEVFGLLYAEMCKIQNNLYPYGKGSLYLAEYLQELRKVGSLTPEIRQKFRF